MPATRHCQPRGQAVTAAAKDEAIHTVSCTERYHRRFVPVPRLQQCHWRGVQRPQGLLYAGVQRDLGRRSRHPGIASVTFPLITSHVFVLLGWEADPVEPTAWCYRDSRLFGVEKDVLLDAASRALSSRPTTIKVAIRRDS